MRKSLCQGLAILDTSAAGFLVALSAPFLRRSHQNPADPRLRLSGEEVVAQELP